MCMCPLCVCVCVCVSASLTVSEFRLRVECDSARQQRDIEHKRVQVRLFLCVNHAVNNWVVL
ncbi:MAG TPA: hypothetical protein V6C97_21475 [Oculatellaceae cyanobacterium]